jgi:hypothetical protein
MRNNFPSKAVVDSLRETYPVGCHVELVCMDDPYSRLKPGDRGEVRFVDDIGTIHVKWDNGSGLGVAYGVDHVKKL